jgi:hypothetical protein
LGSGKFSCNLKVDLMMSNKLFLAGLATAALAVTSLTGVASSQAGVAVGGGTQAIGTFPGGTATSGGSLGVATGNSTAAVSGSSSFATPVQANSGTVVAAQAGPKIAAGAATSGVVVGPGVGFGQAGAAAGNNGVGASFAGSDTGAISFPGFGKAGAVSSFGSVGF